MKAIILAAGRGSRMKKLTYERPKCLVELDGKTLLDWQIGALYKAGIDEIGIVTGYKRELLAGNKFVEFYNSRWNETQMVSSLMCADDWLRSETCIVSYSDIFYSPNAIELLMGSLAEISITYDKNWYELWSNRFDDPLSDAESFCLDSDGVLIDIGGSPKSIDDVQGQYMGLLRISQKGWLSMKRVLERVLPSQLDNLHMTALLQMIIDSQGVEIEAIPFSGCWGEIDSEEDLLWYQKSKMLNVFREW